MEPILGQLAQTVSSAEDLEGLTRPLLELLELVTGMESTYLTRIDEAQGLQFIVFARNSRTMQIPEGLAVPWADTLCKRALEEQRPYTDDVETCWGDSEAARALGIKTYLSQPVLDRDGAVFGTLCAASAGRIAVDTATLQVLSLFARLITHQVEQERRLEALRASNQQLATHALIDPLTGVANRRALRMELNRALSRAQRDQITVNVAFIDLDGFKSINDQYGHEVGDSFLAHIARRLASGIRSTDFLARIGGDEFVVVTFNASADDLRGRIEQKTIGPFIRNDVVIDYRGASVGVANSDMDDCDADSLLARADAAMYQIKRRRKHWAQASCAA